MIPIMTARACGGMRALGLDKRHLGGDLCLGHRSNINRDDAWSEPRGVSFLYRSPASPLRPCETLMDQRLIFR